MFLLDTPIVLELRKAKSGRTDPGLTRWAGEVPSQNLFLSALSLMELETAVTQAGRRDRAAGQHLRDWLDQRVVSAFEGRILAVDAAVVRRRGQLGYADARDGLLAATALEHNLTLVTRNLDAFKAGRVRLFNPWGYAPAAGAAETDADWRNAARTGTQWLRTLFLRL